MLWQTRGRHWPPELNEDLRRAHRSKQKCKSHAWTTELGDAINTSTAISSNYCCPYHYKRCCLTIDNVALISKKPFVISMSCGRYSTVNVQRFAELIDYINNLYSGFGQQSAVCSHHMVISQFTLLSHTTEVSTLVGRALPIETELKTAEIIDILTTLPKRIETKINESWYCHASAKANDASNSDKEYIVERQRNFCTALSTATSASSSSQALPASFRSSPQQQKFRNRSHRGFDRHFTSLSFIVTGLLLVLLAGPVDCGHAVHCGKLLIGQYRCADPEINVVTQQALGCSPNNSAPVVCTLAAELFCREGTGINETHFISEVECEWTNGYSFEFSLLLSVFLGWLGLDRLYLGYPGLALAKFCTLGGIFLWQLIDIILIAMQVVRPADGSQYVVSYFGPRLTRLALNNDTQILAQDDW